MSKFTMNIGPGNTIGAMAIGSGAKAEGTVTIGGAQPKHDPDKVKATIEIKAARPEHAAKWLRDMADAIENGHTRTFAASKLSGASVAWTWSEDK